MTKPKKAFAEMLVAARGSGDVDDICEQMSLMDIIYELKRLEKEEEPVTTPEPEPVTAPEPEPVATPEPKAPEPVLEPPRVPEAPQRVFRPSFWSRLTCDDEEQD
jgi:hypothetical protein